MKLFFTTLALCAFSYSLCAFPANPGGGGGGNERWATVRGQIVFDGEQPPSPAIIARPNGLAPVTVPSWVVNSRNKGVKNVFVWLAVDDVDRGIHMQPELIHPTLRKPPAATVRITIDQMLFTPSSFACRSGQSFSFENTSAEVTNLRSQSLDVDTNVVVPVDKTFELPILKAEKVPLILSSNIHPWMRGVIRVFDHPYYAVTDDDGKFEMPLVPVGPLRIYVWHHEYGYYGDRKGEKGMPIIVKPRVAVRPGADWPG